MARPRYPSDEKRRKTRPHLRVHFTTRTHRIMGPISEDPEERGLLWGLWFVAAQAYAGQTGNIVTLTHAELRWITGRGRIREQLPVLVRLCRRAGYRVWLHHRKDPVPAWTELQEDLARCPLLLGADPARAWREARADLAPTSREPGADLARSSRGPGESLAPISRDLGAVSVHVRNLLKRQMLDSAGGGATPRDSAPPNSEDRTPKTEDRGGRELRTEHAESEDPPARDEERGDPQREEERPRGADAVAEAWDGMLAAVGEYVSVNGWELSPPRRRAIGHLMSSYADRGPEVLAQLAHGFMARHETHGDNFDPFAALLPGTILDPAKAQDRLEAFDRARADRGPPPWFPKGPRAGTGGGRMIRARDAAQGALDLLRNHDEGDEP